MKSLAAFALALFAVGYGLHGVLTDHLYIPLKRNASVVLTGTPVVVMFAGLVAIAIYLVLFGIEELSGEAGRNQYAVIKWPMVALGALLIFVSRTM